MTGLGRRVHDALNATAAVRRPDDALLPPQVAGATRPLAEPLRPGAGLVDAAVRRRSTYAFGPAPAESEVAAVLRWGVGVAPRAGGLSSVSAFLVGPGSDWLAPGVHRADPRLPVAGLDLVRAGDPTAYVAGSLDQPAFAPRVPMWLALVADLAPSRGRYPARHYRTVHVDAGAALQGALLAATAVGLVTCPVSGFDDEAWSLLLDLPASAFVVVLVALGQPPRLKRAVGSRAW